MGRLSVRAFMVAVGIATFLVYTAAGIGGLLLLAWLFENPPGLLEVAAGLVAGILFAGYLGYRLGTARLVASLDAAALPEHRAPAVYRRLERLCGRMAVDQPPLLVADLGAPNALSLGGPRQGAIVLDDDLLRLLTIDELEGIIAHELAHIERYDTFVQTTIVTAMRTVVALLVVLFFPVVLVLLGIDRGAAWIAGRPGEWRYGLAWLFQWALQVLVSVLLSLVTLGVLAYSRRTEYAADRRAAEVTGKPVALARALTKIHRAADPRRGVFSLLYIQRDPDSGARRLLSTHPPLPDRVDRLVQRADSAVPL